MDGHRPPAVAAADLAELQQAKYGCTSKALPGVLRIQLFQGIGGVRINGDELFDAMELQVPGHEPGVLHKALLIPQVVEQDAAVEIHLGMIEEVHPRFVQETANGPQDAVKFLFFRPRGQQG